MDAHTLYPPDYLARGLERLRRGDVEWVSGPQLPHGVGKWSRRIALALGTRLGIGGAAFRNARARDRRSTPGTPGSGAGRPCCARAAGISAGRSTRTASSPRAFARPAGGSSASRRWRRATLPRDSLRALARQYWRYGIYRAKTCGAHPESMRRSHLLPPARGRWRCRRSLTGANRVARCARAGTARLPGRAGRDRGLSTSRRRSRRLGAAGGAGDHAPELGIRVPGRLASLRPAASSDRQPGPARAADGGPVRARPPSARLDSPADARGSDPPHGPAGGRRPPGSEPPQGGMSRGVKWAIAALVAVVIGLGVALAVVASDDSGGGGTTTTTATTQSVTPTTPTTTATTRPPRRPPPRRRPPRPAPARRPRRRPRPAAAGGGGTPEPVDASSLRRVRARRTSSGKAFATSDGGSGYQSRPESSRRLTLPSARRSRRARHGPRALPVSTSITRSGRLHLLAARRLGPRRRRRRSVSIRSQTARTPRASSSSSLDREPARLRIDGQRARRGYHAEPRDRDPQPEVVVLGLVEPVVEAPGPLDGRPPCRLHGADVVAGRQRDHRVGGLTGSLAEPGDVSAAAGQAARLTRPPPAASSSTQARAWARPIRGVRRRASAAIVSR